MINGRKSIKHHQTCHERNTTTTTMMMTTATTTKTAHSGSPWVQTPTAWLLFVTWLCRRVHSQKNKWQVFFWAGANIVENQQHFKKRTPVRHISKGFPGFYLCFSSSTWLKSYFNDILRDVKNSTIFGHFLAMCFPPSPGGFSFALVLSV